jgi:ribose transport system permease protein
MSSLSASEAAQLATPASSAATGRDEIASVVRGALESPFVRIWVLAAALFAASAIVEPGTVTRTALLSMLPFAAILALASAGQTLVIQQGGVDLSSAGVISLTAVIIVQASGGEDGRLAFATVVALAAAVVAGLVIGLAVTQLAITPLIATLAVNAILTGVVLSVTGGNIADAAPASLTSAVSHKILGIQLVVWVPVALITLMTVALRKTVAGRRFEAIGAGPATARAMGLPVARYEIGAYVLAALTYCAAGILLAGFIARPDLFSGNTYLLLTIAAVAIGGTSFGGGRGSLVATTVGALFLVQLNQLVLATGTPDATQSVIQGVVLVAGIGLRGGRVAAAVAWLVRSRGTPAASRL